MKLVLGIDFDGTIVQSKYPHIGKLRFGAKWALQKLSKEGHKLILWTCRENKFLKDAINFCASHDISFYLYNQNCPERIEKYKGDCRKLSCDILLDDTAGIIFWPWFYMKVRIKQWRKQRNTKSNM